MSVEALSWAIKQKPKTPIQKLVLLCMANYTDANQICFPSYRHLADICNTSGRTVINATKALEQQGFVQIIHRFNKQGKQISNYYKLLLEGEADNTVGVKETTPSIDTKDNTQKKTKQKKEYDAEFCKWWDCYPRKDGSKSKAYDIWQKVTTSEIRPTTLYHLTYHFAQANKNTDPKFIPHATTWLNQHRWETAQPTKTQTKNHLAG